jgi:hypothetical protein
MNPLKLLRPLALALLCTPALAINNGTPTTAFASVGPWAVQVAPDWVLTAYHVGLGEGSSFTNGYGTRTVAARYDAPGSGEFPANDLILLRLTPATTGAPYLAINDVFIPNGSFAPLDVTIVSGQNSGPDRGYGFTTVSESQVMVDPDDAGPLSPVLANYLVSYDSQVFVQGGDSGGGLFLGHVTDSSVLLGITSALFTDENNMPIGSGFVQLAAYRSWIDGVMAADTADTQVLNWVSAVAVPEPATWLLWAAGAAGLLAARRRQRPTAA